MLIFSFFSPDALKRGNTSVTCVIHAHNVGAPVIAPTPLENRIKNHDTAALVGAKKDEGNAIILGSLIKKSKHQGSASAIHILESEGNIPLPLPLVMVVRLHQNTKKMKDDVSAQDYAHARQLSKIDKSNLLAESNF